MSPLALALVRPAVRYRETFLTGLREFRAEGLAWHLALDVEVVERDFDAFVESKLAEACPADEASLPKTQLWAIAEGRFVGRVGIFHRLTEALALDGGHIGYDTVPSFRGRGVATEMLRQALPLACELGVKEAVLTCDETNHASIRVIEKNGGVLRETRTPGPGRAAKRIYVVASSEVSMPSRFTRSNPSGCGT